MTEEWRDISGYEGKYQISNSGRVKSLAREHITSRGGRYTQSERILRQHINHNGYPCVNLWRDGKGRVKAVHILLLEAFVGERPPGFHACHSDGNPANLSLDNLRWDTPSANQKDRIKHGTHHRGSRHGNAKLSEEKVKYIFEELAKMRLQVDLARELGVSESAISMVVTGRSWHYPS